LHARAFANPQAIDPNLAALAEEASKTPFEDEGGKGKKAAKEQNKKRKAADADASRGDDGRGEATGRTPLAMDIRSMCVAATVVHSSWDGFCLFP
jgi:hypothetical protein